MAIPVDGMWSEWTIHECSVTCGEGLAMKTRTCDNPAPQFGGQHCTGEESGEEVCQGTQCPGKTQDPVKALYLDIISCKL